MDKTQIRDAATIIVLRDAATVPSVLMGQRGSSAAFMPGKFVFPGGAVDPVDADVPVTLDQVNASGLSHESTRSPTALAAAAIRELWEETGHILGHRAHWPNAPKGWRGFAASGHQPNGQALQFFFRAITPPGRPRRFDARFFLTDAAALTTDLDDFSNAEDELAHLQWIPLQDAQQFDLPYITQVVLSELSTQIKTGKRPETVPFFRNNDEDQHLLRLDGGIPL
jgi:8-oxo-dGTP pyrophosphatase MutT (NUDIX family)